MTDWDIAYSAPKMPAPTNLNDLMPDPYGHFDRLADERVTSIVTAIVRTLTLLIAIGLAVAAWVFFGPYLELLP